MIKFIETKQQELIVYFNNNIVFKHDYENPILFLGYGEETIDSYRGNYTISDKINRKLGLESYRLEKNSIVFFHNDIEVKLTFTEEAGRLKIQLVTSEGYNRFWIRIYAEKDEEVYGLGEQPSYFNLRHHHFPLWTSESGVGRDKNSQTTKLADEQDRAGGDYYTTYYPEPTFVSTRKYWVHFNSYVYAEMNFINETYHEAFFMSPLKTMILSYRDSYLDLLEDLTDYTGRPNVLPDFLLDGVILGVQGGIDKVLEYLRQAQESGVKVSGLWCQDWAGIRYTTFGKRLHWNWTLNEKLYPKLQDVIKELDKENVAFLTYICPFLLENESLYNEAAKKDLLALDKDGKIYNVDFGEFYCGIVDLTNPAAFNWYKNIIKKNIIDLGIKGWMADFGEYLPVDCVLHNGVEAKFMHNEWPVLWAKCNYEAVQESGKSGEIFYFMRAGGHGSQHYASSLWSGDQSVNWDLHDGIPSVIPSALSAGMTGIPFIHSDIGGYTSLYGNIRTKELFERWLEMNVFTTYMRTHEGNRPSQNFQFYDSRDTLSLMKRMTDIRTDLVPYIKQLILEGAQKGYPVQRPLFLHYESDENAYKISYQYLFGKDVLVTPVIQPNQQVQSVYLPEDEWVHLWTGKEFIGKGTIEIEAPIGFPAVFYRKQSTFKSLFESITKKYK